MIEALFGEAHGGYIATAYGVTTASLVAIAAWTFLVRRARARRLRELEGR